MDDRHFGYITKMENKKHTGRCFFSGELIFTILRKEFSENILSQIPFLKTKIAKKKPNDKKRRPESPQLLPIWKGAFDLILSCFEYRQIWLNIQMNYRHLSNVTKLTRKTAQKKKHCCPVAHRPRERRLATCR